MIPAEELNRLLQRAQEDSSAEPAFFHALLDATVYAHVPGSDRSGRPRFIQFTTPEGLTVLPFFSDEVQARAAAGFSAAIVAMTGRELLEITRGATLILNPNAVSCMLYPEEVSALLDRDEVAVIDRLCTNDRMAVDNVSDCPDWFIGRLIAFCASMSCIEAAYLAQIGGVEVAGHSSLLVAMVTSSKDAERVMRAATTDLQAKCRTLQTPLDLMALSPGDLPGWIAELGLKPFYDRSETKAVDPASLKAQ